MSGVLVTVPHKQRAATLVDELTPRARHLNAVNVIHQTGGWPSAGSDMLDSVGFSLAQRPRFRAEGDGHAALRARRRRQHIRGTITMKPAFASWRRPESGTRYSCCITVSLPISLRVILTPARHPGGMHLLSERFSGGNGEFRSSAATATLTGDSRCGNPRRRCRYRPGAHASWLAFRTGARYVIQNRPEMALQRR